MDNRMVGLRPAWALAIACALSLAACGDDGGDTSTDDMGVTMDGEMPDPCEGLTLCTAAGTSCSGDSLVTCAANADGCLVESTMNCASVGGTCDDSGAAAMCQTDPCADIEQCDAEGITCDGETLVDCAMNADGCLVATETDCAAMDGGECDDSGATVMCVLPADPCEDIPAAERCDTEGTSCDGDSLTTCAPNAFGCLVETTEDCTGRTGGACDDSGAAAICTATDACAGITECAAAGTMCDGPELVTCAPDAFGCLVETRNDCTETMFGFCDADGTASCSTAATDPCMGMTTCDAAGRSCDGDTLEVCALNAFGCLVETPTDCTTDGNVCGDADGTAQCGPVCSFRDVCSGMTYCDSSDLVSCMTDADGCLVEDDRSSCGDGVCTPDACVGNCAGASPVVIDCASGTVNGDTAMGTATIAGYSGCTTLGYPGNEQVFLFQNATAAEVSITSTRLTGTGDYDLFVLDGGDGTAACGTADTCIDGSTTTSANETVEFVSDPGDLHYIAFDLYNVATETTDFTLDITCTPVVCGDGVVSGNEECDDDNTADTDGCSATCTVESGFVCDDSEPSTCRATVCGDGVIEGDEECDDDNATATDGCSDTCVVESGFVCEGEPSTCRATVCGDGVIEGDEECDDDNATATDGCSDTCALESGFRCIGEPSTCAVPATNATCGGATAISTDTSLTGENIVSGGARPQGTGCGTSSGDSALYYEVTIPASTQVAVTTSNSTLDRVLLFQDSCAATSCSFRTDTSPESGTLVNATTSPVTRIVAVHNYSEGASGTYDISFAYSPSTYTIIPEACVDTSTATALGVTGDDATSSVAALPFSLDWFGATATHFSVSSNGFVQVWPDGTGSPTSAFSNSRLPSTSSPNGVVAPFWDDQSPISGAGSNIYSLTTGSSGSQRFVIEWRNWQSYEGDNDLTFQAHFIEATGAVEFHYCDMTAGSDARHTGSAATIGAENFGGTAGFSISHNTANAVMSGSAFTFDP
ncbi:MAG: DUF4215 domain-containing protein [Deltaproteobacteria bacterium]|nr:DUF4215 domain-containing protein [Deltaproteobacteria bacterium]